MENESKMIQKFQIINYVDYKFHANFHPPIQLPNSSYQKGKKKSQIKLLYIYIQKIFFLIDFDKAMLKNVNVTKSF